MPEPSVGRIVRYVATTPGHHSNSVAVFPAIITAIFPREDAVFLTVFTTTGTQTRRAVEDPERAVGTWHWPVQLPAPVEF